MSSEDDEHPASSGRRRNVAQKTFNVNVENNSGQVVFGAKRASIEDAPLNHPTGDKNLDSPTTRARQPLDNIPPEVVKPDGTRIPEETIREVDEHPGSRARRRPVVQETWNIKVIGNSGQVAVSAERASIKGALLNHPTDISIM